MEPDPIQTIIGQFSRFAVEVNLSRSDWEMAATEFGVHTTASNINRFYRSWHWGDDDRQVTAVRFLRTVANEDEDVALGIMKRLYSMADPDFDLNQKYPALEVIGGEERDPAAVGIPQVQIHSERFIDIDNVPGAFYPDLVKDVNRCYRLGIYDATLVLTRKLLENLLIDVLRRKYDTNRIEHYHQPHNGRFQNFSTLIDNFEDHINDFQYLSGGLNEDFINELNSFRQNANAEAHSIETSITEDEMETYQDQARHASQILFRVMENL